MDARDRLRRYLEQRRELGESELVLDGMDVEDVMALLGARQASRSPRAAQSPVSATTPAATTPAATTPAATSVAPPEELATPADVQEVVAPPAPAPRFDSSASGDWRQTLSQASAAVPPVAPDARARAG